MGLTCCFTVGARVMRLLYLLMGPVSCWMQRSSRMTPAGFWADPAKTGQLEDLVTHLVLAGM
jgi:hypothetical protein